MAAHEVPRDRQAQPGAADPTGSGEGLEQSLANRFGQAGPVIGYGHPNRAVIQRGTDPNRLRRRLKSVEREVGKHAAELFAVGLDSQVLRHLTEESRGARPAFEQIGADLGHQPAKVESRKGGRRLAFMGEGYGLGAQPDRPVERAEQSRCDLAHPRVRAHADMVRNELCARQDVSQVVVDLGNRRAQRGKAGSVLQCLPHRLLQLRELPTGAPDLVRPRTRRHHASRVLRIGAEGGHVFRNAQHRADEEKLKADKDECRGNQRNNDGEHQDSSRIAEHFRPHRRFVDHRPDQGAGRFGKWRHNLDHPVPAPSEDEERLPDQRKERGVTQVVDGFDRQRRLARDRHLVGHGAGHDPVRSRVHEEIGRQPRGNGAIDRGRHRQRGKMGRRDPLLHVDHAVAPDRRRIDEHLAQHHEKDRQYEQARR